MSDPAVEEYNQRIVEKLKAGEKIIPLCDSILGLQFTYLTLSKWIKRGSIPALRIGSRWYTSNDVLADWLSANQGRVDFMSGVRGPKLGSKRTPKVEQSESSEVSPEDLL